MARTLLTRVGDRVVVVTGNGYGDWTWGTIECPAHGSHSTPGKALAAAMDSMSPTPGPVFAWVSEH